MGNSLTKLLKITVTYHEYWLILSHVRAEQNHDKNSGLLHSWVLGFFWLYCFITLQSKIWGFFPRLLVCCGYFSQTRFSGILLFTNTVTVPLGALELWFLAACLSNICCVSATKWVMNVFLLFKNNLKDKEDCILFERKIQTFEILHFSSCLGDTSWKTISLSTWELPIFQDSLVLPVSQDVCYSVRPLWFSIEFC